MIALLSSLGAWNGFIAAAVLLILELIAPGVYMLWLGIAALIVGLLSLAIDWNWQFQGVAFAAIAVELCRAATTGQGSWVDVGHVAALCACVVAGAWWGHRTCTRRLSP